MKTFSEKLIALRRQAGFSQEQLAGRLGVTRQSVSKWESGAAMPELLKLIALSDLFAVSIDFLVKDQLEEPDAVPVPTAPSPSTTKLEAQVEELSSFFRVWSWDSRTRVFGLPLISIRFHAAPRMLRARGKRDIACGIIAIGNIAVGVIALGAFSVGLLGIGAISIGAFALGALAFGLAALGPVAIGLLAFGPVAIGLWYAGGVTALGGKIAVGLAAVGETAVGRDAAGKHTLLWGGGLTRQEVEAFLLVHHPHLWRPLLHLLSFLGANLC